MFDMKFDFLGDNFYIATPTGSRYICDPPVMDTDEDYIILVKDIDDEELNECLWNHDFVPSKGIYQDNRMVSWRRSDDVEKTNLLVMDDLEYYNKWVKATKTAKEQNLLHKVDRIKLFEKIFNEQEEENAEIPF